MFMVSNVVCCNPASRNLLMHLIGNLCPDLSHRCHGRGAQQTILGYHLLFCYGLTTISTGCRRRMRRQLFRKYVSFLMSMVMFTISVAGFCQSAHSFELSVDPHARTGGHLSAAIETENGCPICPMDGHSESEPDHCESSCYCACHAPLMPQPVQIVCSRQSSPLIFIESFKAIPEVYLSKFIPPQNLA